jgi:geranylgeranylglycerol-phosphate geranylgeranyltransferase
MTKAAAAIEILRPHNMLAAASCVVGGFAISGGTSWAPIVWPAVLTGLVTGFGNLVNDLHDRDIDRFNKPHRPLPSGRLTPAFVRALYTVGTVAVTVIAIGTLDGGLRVLVLSWQVLLYIYARFGKRLVFGGALLVAFIAASALFAGALAAGSYGDIGFAAAFAFLLIMGRELIKAAEDVEGDRRAGAVTPAVRYGGRNVAVWGVGLLLVCVAAAPVPGLTEHYAGLYLPAMALLFSPGVLAAGAMALRTPERLTLARVSSILKVQMFVGIAALVSARL